MGNSKRTRKRRIQKEKLQQRNKHLFSSNRYTIYNFFKYLKNEKSYNFKLNNLNSKFLVKIFLIL